jgi:hypothetical protein
LDVFPMRFWDRATEHTIKKLGVKSIYPLPKRQRASYPVTSHQLGGKSIVPGMRTGFDYTEGKPGRMHKAALFNAAFPSLMPQYKSKLYLVSSGAAGNYGYDVYPSTFKCAVGSYTAIRLCDGNWINDKDELKFPNKLHPNYMKYIVNSIIFTMFDIQNNTTSMVLDHPLGKFRLRNHFFWSTRSSMKLAYPQLEGYEESEETINTNAGYYDKNVPYALRILREHSDLILECGHDLLFHAAVLNRKSMDCRIKNNKTQWHRWDASFYQLRQIFRMIPEYENDFMPTFYALKEKLSQFVEELEYWSKNDWSHKH